MQQHRLDPAPPAPIRRQREAEVFGNRFGRLFNDEVVFPNGSQGRYLRWQWKQQGVVVVPVGPGGLALVPTYRYPIGAPPWSFHAAAASPGKTPVRPRRGNWRRKQRAEEHDRSMLLGVQEALEAHLQQRATGQDGE